MRRAGGGARRSRGAARSKRDDRGLHPRADDRPPPSASAPDLAARNVPERRCGPSRGKPQAQSYELLAALAILQPGDDVGVHTHPGPEAWYVLAGEQCLETAVGLSRAHTGQTMVAPAATPMKLVITGSSLRRAFFIVLHDAAQPWMGESTWQHKGRCNRN